MTGSLPYLRTRRIATEMSRDNCLQCDHMENTDDKQWHSLQKSWLIKGLLFPFHLRKVPMDFDQVFGAEARFGVNRVEKHSASLRVRIHTADRPAGLTERFRHDRLHAVQEGRPADPDDANAVADGEVRPDEVTCEGPPCEAFAPVR